MYLPIKLDETWNMYNLNCLYQTIITFIFITSPAENFRWRQ
jgi:hypothetical protein